MPLSLYRLVFIYSTSAKTNMTRLYGRSAKGTWLEANALYGHWKTQTFIAGLRHDGIKSPWVLDGGASILTFMTVLRFVSTLVFFPLYHCFGIVLERFLVSA